MNESSKSKCSLDSLVSPLIWVWFVGRSEEVNEVIFDMNYNVRICEVDVQVVQKGLIK